MKVSIAVCCVLLFAAILLFRRLDERDQRERDVMSCENWCGHVAEQVPARCIEYCVEGKGRRSW